MVSLEVEFVPVIILRPHLSQVLQGNIILKCRIEAYPFPVITWIRDNAELSSNQQYRISHSTSSREMITHSELHINSVQTEHYGRYICRAVNKFGRFEQSVNLHKTHIPT